VEPGFEVFVAKARRGQTEKRNGPMSQDGSRLPVLLSVSAVRAEDGTLTGFLGIAADISERKQTQASLRDSENRYKALFESAGDAVILIDDDRFIDCNSATLEMFGCTREEIIGATPVRFSPSVSRTDACPPTRRWIRSPAPSGQDTVFRMAAYPP